MYARICARKGCWLIKTTQAKQNKRLYAKFDIDLELDVKTHPTIGPLFGRYKVQLDVFEVPLRLYHGMMRMNLS